MKESMNSLLNLVVTNGTKILIAIVVLIVSFWLIKFIAKKIEKRLYANQKLDQTLVRTISHVILVVLRILIVIALIGYLGIDTSGFAALIASLGVAAGLAINGALSNLAGGMLILVTRPFKVGDYINAQGFEGTVEHIRIISTKLKTLDNKTVYIPNGALSGGSILNFSEQEIRRVDQNYVITDDAAGKAIDILMNNCLSHEKVLKDPAPFTRITEFGAGSGTTVTIRAWVKSADYWDVFLDLLEKNKKAFEGAGIAVPVNRSEVRILENKQ